MACPLRPSRLPSISSRCIMPRRFRTPVRKSMLPEPISAQPFEPDVHRCSYGGTALLTLMLGVGILMSIQTHRMLVKK